MPTAQRASELKADPLIIEQLELRFGKRWASHVPTQLLTAYLVALTRPNSGIPDPQYKLSFPTRPRMPSNTASTKIRLSADSTSPRAASSPTTSDGGDKTYYRDPHKQSKTSLVWLEDGKRAYPNADKVPYIVVAPDLMPKSGARPGDLARVDYNGK